MSREKVSGLAEAMRRINEDIAAVVESRSSFLEEFAGPVEFGCSPPVSIRFAWVPASADDLRSNTRRVEWYVDEADGSTSVFPSLLAAENHVTSTT